MKISIIIPIYNVENEIERCLSSVVEQDYKNLEVVLVNDCTPDDSFILARAYMEKSHFYGDVQYIEHAENGGLSVARNTGINASTGDYIFFLDSDDALVDTSALSSLMNSILMGEKADVVIGGYVRIGINNNTEYIKNLKNYNNNEEIFSAYANREFNDYAWGKLINRNFLVSNDLYFYPGLFFEDALWAFYLYRVAENIKVIDNIVCSYYEREGSITSTFNEKWVRDYNQIVVMMYETYLNNKNYYPKQTVMVIERRRRDSLRHIFAFKQKGNNRFIEQQVRVLKKVHLPLVLNNFKYIEQNLILRLPLCCSLRYFSRKWGNRKYGLI